MIFDLISGKQEEGPPASLWTPADLFQNNETGFWFDATDFDTMFQDSSGTIPVTAVGQPVGLWKNKIIGLGSNTFKYDQSSSSRMPVVADVGGKLRLSFDAVDDRVLLRPVPTTVSLNAATVGIGFTLGSNVSGMYIYDWQGTYIQVSTAPAKLSGTLLNKNFTTTNTLNTAGQLNSHVWSGSSSQTASAILNNVLTTSSGPTTGNTVSMSTKELPNDFTATPFRVNHFVFLTRAVTAEEQVLLEEFIRTH